MTDTQHFDVIVMGGGSGLTAAYFAERDGKRVALVERNPDALGGTCVNYGCIPTKGLIQAAEVLHTIRHAEDFGIKLDQESVTPDFNAIMGTVRERRAKGSKGVRGWVESAFTPFFGAAKFVGDRTLEMEDGRRLSGHAVFVCTGARAAIPPIPGLDQIHPLTNKSILELEEQPSSLVILGGGYIGCEFAHFFSALGTDVKVIESKSCLLLEDPDVRSLFTQEFSKRVTLYNGARAERAIDEGGQVGFEVTTQDGSTEKVLGDQVLVAVGRTPNTDGLGLESTGVETNERGWIVVNEHLETTCPGIYAYGDIIGQGMFKHTSSYEGELAYRNSQGAADVVDYRTNPHAVFSHPQVAAVGLTETEAKEKGLDHGIAKSDYSSIMKGEIIGSPAGFAKLVYERDTGRILGFHMIGPNVADLIHEVIVAMNVGNGTVDNIRKTIHIHPTMPELIRSVFDNAEI